MREINTLYVNGDSWTYGHGLMEDPRALTLAEIEGASLPVELFKYAWPRWLADDLGIPHVVNESMGGGSNTRIVRLVVQKIASTPPEALSKTLVVLGFTDPSRSEIYLKNEHPFRTGWFRFNMHYPFSKDYPPRKNEILPERARAIDKYQRMHSMEIYEEQGSLEVFFNQVFLLKNLLENNNVPYLFFNALAITNNTSNIRKEYLDSWFESPNIIDLSTSMHAHMDEWGIQFSTCLHPFMEGQEAWGKYLSRTIINNNILGV